MSSTFAVESPSLPSFTDVVGAAELGEALQLVGAGFTGASWPRGLYAKIADASTMESPMQLTPEVEASFERAGLAGCFLAFTSSSARGVVVSRAPFGVTFSVLALSSREDYRIAVRLASAAARLAGTKVSVSDDTTQSAEEVAPEAALERFGVAFADANALQVGTWLVEDIAAGRTYHFQGPRGFTSLAPEQLQNTPKEERLARARMLLLGAGEGAADVLPDAEDPRRVAVLLTAAMVYAAGADGRLDDEEARQLEAHFATIKELAKFPARELLDAVNVEVPSIESLRHLPTAALRRKAFVLAAEVIASAQGGKLGGAATDPNVQAISALATALRLENEQSFIARVVSAVMAKYRAASDDTSVVSRFVLGMLLAAAADGHIDEQESALLAALARTVPDLRTQDVEALFSAARARMNEGLEVALADLGALGGQEDKCFALTAEVALVAGHGEAGTMLPVLREHIRPDPAYAESAIATFAAKYA